jgi:hypothetical protein
MDSHKANARIWHMIVRWCIDGILSLRRGFAQTLNALVASQNKPRFRHSENKKRVVHGLNWNWDTAIILKNPSRIGLSRPEFYGF